MIQKSKKCIRCCKKRSITAFRFRNDTQRYKNCCRICERAGSKLWRKHNYNKIIAYENTTQRRIASSIRRRLNAIIKSKSYSTFEYVGCSSTELIKYLASQFYSQPGTGKKMSWQNYGKWHIDHIIPLSYFDLTIEEELIQAWHYTNLQPLWAEENLKKGAKHDLH